MLCKAINNQISIKNDQKLSGLRFIIVLPQIIFHSFDHAKVFVMVTISRSLHEMKKLMQPRRKNVSRFMCESPSPNMLHGEIHVKC